MAAVSDPGDGESFRKVLRRRRGPLLVAVLILALVALAFWPPASPAAAEDTTAVASYHRKLGALRDAATLGQATRQTLSQAEINARLAELMAANHDARDAEGLTVGLESLSAHAREGHLALFVEARLVSLPLVFESRFGSSPGGEHPLVLRSLRLGRLPLLGPLRQLVASRMQVMFRQVEPERSLFSRIGACQYREGELELAVMAAEQ